MNLLDVLTSPWAILPDKLQEIQAIYATHLRGEKIDLAAVEARLGRTLSNEQKAYEVQAGGVGVLPAMGVMSPRANMFMQISGGISTSMLAKQFQSMEADPRVRSALIHADSPGGNVLGVPAAVDALRLLAAAKPTVLVGEGTVASAMYWLGSAANAMFIEGGTDMVGSLGVVMRLGWDTPSANSVELVRGKYKRASADGKGPTPQALAQAEGQLDYLYGLLIDAVAQHRGVNAHAVLERMADGRVFIGQQAVDAGLVDGFSTVDAMAERLATNPAEFAQRRKSIFLPAASTGVVDLAATHPQPKEPVSLEGDPSLLNEGKPIMSEATKPLTLEALAADHAAVHAQAVAVGAERERTRIVGVRATLIPGHEALVEQLAMDGKTTPEQAAMAVNAAQRNAMAATAAALAGDAPTALKPSATAADLPGSKEVTKVDQVAEAKKYAADHKVSFVEAMKQLGFAS